MLMLAHGVDAGHVPVGPGQHQHRDSDAAGPVSVHEHQAQESSVRARRAQPVCGRDGRPRDHDQVSPLLRSLIVKGALRQHGNC